MFKLEPNYEGPAGLELYVDQAGLEATEIHLPAFAPSGSVVFLGRLCSVVATVSEAKKLRKQVDTSEDTSSACLWLEERGLERLVAWASGLDEAAVGHSWNTGEASFPYSLCLQKEALTSLSERHACSCIIHLAGKGWS